MVSEIVGWDRSPKVAALMIGCWSKDIWTSVLSEMGQGEVMGSIRCTWIAFYPRRDQPITSLTTIEVLLSQPTSRSEDPLQHQYRCIVSLS